MAQEPAFQQLQRAFAAHIRNPEQAPRPAEVPERRMRVYRELIFRTIDGLVANAFPVLRRILGADRWEALMRAFVAEHACETPLFNEIAGEFVEWLAAHPGAVEGLPAFAPELAHYEWVELALMVEAIEPDPSHADPNGDLLAGVPVLSPLAWPLAYQYPVHQLSPDYLPEAPPAQPTWLLAHRTRQDAVRFTGLNAISARLLGLIAAEPDTGQALLDRIAAEAGFDDPTPVRTEGARQMQAWRESDILLGVRHAQSARGERGDHGGSSSHD